MLNKNVYYYDNDSFNKIISQVLNFKVTLSPNKLKTDQLTRLSQLERRLRKLEIIVGSEKLALVRSLNDYQINYI